MKELINLFNKSPIVIFEWGKINKWTITSVTSNVENLVGYSQNEVLDKKFNYLKLLSKADQESVNNQIVDNLKSKNNNFNLITHQLKNKKNEIIWVDTYIHVKRNNQGRVIGFIGYIIDVTKHKKTEIDLLDAKEKYQIISDSTVDGIFILDKFGTMIFVNQGMLNLSGRSIEELQDVHFSKYVPKRELPRYLLTLKDVFLRKEVKNFSTKIIHKSGKLLDVEINGKLIKQNGKLVAQGSMRDISSRKDIENALIRNQKLNTLGEIASSVAHDFNNSLQAILSNVELILSLNEKMELESLSYLKTIKSLVLDASNRVKVLQRFGGRKEIFVYSTLDVKKIIEDVVAQFAPRWRSDSEKNGITINVSLDFGKNLIIEGNEGELHSVIHNLLKNSIEAMPKGGDIKFYARKKNNNVEILLTDTGIGMTEETQAKIFQAFYTTKGFALGRGLGLSGVYRILKEHKGDIYVVNSSLNKGTSIKIILPYYKNKNEKNVDDCFNETNNFQELRESLKILWVDDEPIIRNVLKQYLKLLKFEFDMAGSGEEALELMKTNNYNLVITDIGMPNMNGWQLIDKIRDLYSKDIKIIVVSGWILEIRDEHKEKYNIYDILEKPIQFKKLEEILYSFQ